MMSIEFLIKGILETGQYSETEVAKLLGVSPRTVRRFKTGKNKSTSYQTYAKALLLYIATH